MPDERDYVVVSDRSFTEYTVTATEYRTTDGQLMFFDGENEEPVAKFPAGKWEGVYQDGRADHFRDE